jgi:DNA-binding CsgD family transcriptional regulator
VVWTNKAITVRKGKPVEILSVGNDITKRKKAEQEVARRTADLKKINTQLKNELKRSRKLEQALVGREQALEAKTRSLEETNTALKVLLDKREKDRSKLGNTVLSNLKELVHPFLARLKRSGLDATQRAYLDVIEVNLKQVVSPFSQSLSAKYADLTPTEIRVANLVKDGKSTKEIAQLLGSSKRTVDFHRKRLREKLAIRNEKVNLRSYLLSLS